MDNVLFIGNGFDLHNGLKTKYIDYLDTLNQEIISKVILKKLVDSVDKIEFLFYSNEDTLNNKQSQFICTDNIHRIADQLTSLSKDDIIQIEQYGENVELAKMYKIPRFAKSRLNSSLDNSLDNKKNSYFTFLTTEVENSLSKLQNEDKKYLILNCIMVMSISTSVKQEKKYYIYYYYDMPIIKIDARTKLVIEEYIDKYIKYKTAENSAANKSDLTSIMDARTLKCEIEDEIKANNFFEIYLELIRNKIVNYDNDIIELNAGQNWIDVENILYENQFSHFRSKLRQHNDGYSTIKSDIEKIKNSLNLLDENNKLKYQEFIKIFDNDRTVLEDFNNFKEKFAKYVEEEQKKIDTNEVTEFYKKLDEKYEITRVYNFNYSNYLNDIVDTHNKTNNKTTTIQNIHGDVTNGKDIVFGTNHYMFLEDLKQHNKYLENTNLTQYITNEEEEFKLTKMFQVMKIVGDKPQHPFNKVNSLTLLGHSIGIQDYEYIHSIIRTNPSGIKLNIIWTSWVDDNGQDRDNLEELTSGLYKMLGKYEQLHDDLSLHKMLLENRISFINIDEIYCAKKHKRRKTKTNRKNRNKKIIKLNK